MIRTFFDIPFLRIGNSSRMWFSLKDIARVLKLSKQSVTKTASREEFDAVRLHQFDVDFLTATGEMVENKDVRHDRFGLDLVMYLVYKNNLPMGADIRAWIISQISNLCLDGFTSLYNYNLDVMYRRSITSYVCACDSYAGIVRERYENCLDERGMEFAPGYEWTAEDLANPDNYIDRAEITIVRAVDLAIHLLATYSPIRKTHDEIFILLGFDKEKGAWGSQQSEDLVQWLDTKEKETD